MKQFILFLFCILSWSANTQNPNNTFSIKGRIGNYNPPAKIYLQYPENGQLKTISSDMKNGEFSFSGRIVYPTSGAIFIVPEGKLTQKTNADDIISFIVADENVEINAADSLKNALISGSLINRDNELLMKKIDSFIDTYALISGQQADGHSPEFLPHTYEAILKEIRHIQTSFVKENPTSVYSLVLIHELLEQADNANVIDSLFQTLDPELRKKPFAELIASSINEKKYTSIGSIAPDFTQYNLSGKTVKLSDLRGKYVLIDFWASWCRPCREENPYLVKLYERFKEKNFEILGVSLDENRTKSSWLNAIERDNMTWMQVSDLRGWRNEAALQYNIMAIPQNFLLNPEGVIIAKNLRGESLVQKLEEILK
ncbi:MAG: AhpC/TSA family protein [Dysgonamonadaceae bacterium]|nr:AhpC/TSA family protein [Dysgonamonadaceae bacterium]